MPPSLHHSNKNSLSQKVEEEAIEQVMALEKVKPFDSPYEGLGCFKYFFIILNKLQFWSGLVPIKVDKNRSTVEFKLISTSTLLASLRLLLLTFPLILLPLILHASGLPEKEYETVTGKNYTSLYDDDVSGLYELCFAEYCLSFLVYILPLAISYSAIEPLEKLCLCLIEFQNMFVMEGKPSLTNLKQVLFPIMGFILLTLGKLLNLMYMARKEYYAGLYLNRYLLTCYYFLAHLPLHLLLAIHENFLYQQFNLHHVMCSETLKAIVRGGTLSRANVLLEFMEATQGVFGFFILVDITLMLIYWLLHTYHAYFAFQVKTSTCFVTS